MFKTYTPVCNNNCACADSQCMFRHYIRSYKDRKVIVKICKENAQVINLNKKESNVEIRKSNCTYGYLCTNDACNYRHFLNPTGRHIITNLYNNYLDTSSIASVSSSSVASVASVSSNSSRTSSVSSASTVIYKNKNSDKNIYATLEDVEEQIVIAKTKSENIPSIVIVPEIKKFAKSFADIVKKSPDETAQEKFDLMMASETKDCWDDY